MNDKPVTGFKTPTRLDYTIRSGEASASFLRHIKEGRLVGRKCATTGRVYVPPRGPSPVTGLPMVEEVELNHTGTVTTFCVVNVPFEGQTMKIPYVGAAILLDGADIALFHLVGDCEINEVRMGMRVKAIWKPREEWGFTTENILYFAPTGEPDASFESYREYL